MSKMIVDWFADREIATAMAIFVNSWAVGIGIGLLVLPVIVLQNGIQSASLVAAVLVFLGLVALVWLYREPPAIASMLRPKGAGSRCHNLRHRRGWRLEFVQCRLCDAVRVRPRNAR